MHEAAGRTGLHIVKKDVGQILVSLRDSTPMKLLKDALYKEGIETLALRNSSSKPGSTEEISATLTGGTCVGQLSVELLQTLC